MNPTADSERARQHTLDRYHALDTLPSTAYDDLVALAAAICGTPIAVVSLIDRERQWFKARIGLDDHETTRDTAVCDHAIKRPGELLEIPDLAEDSRFAGFPIVTGDVKARFYAGMPLVAHSGEALGTVCVVDTQPRQLNNQQKASLRALARITATLLDTHRAQHEGQALVALRGSDAAPVVAEAYTVVLIEVQGMAEAGRRLGERALEKTLQGLEPVFDACLRHESGDHVSRVTDSAEFVVLLKGADVEARIDALRAAARLAGHRNALVLLVGAAASASADDALLQVYLRAEEALSLQKDALASGRQAA
ncbi:MULTISPECIES: GAF domain-containing protein [unclassified Pseudoxanthomonas]|uniref:GAF domain-containing protein n=1 Tax=unclassified Pseudoxanthomonas TaxID=2645906 RepID=UPI0008F243A3|nr:MULTISPECIES: GAF domain-containing protein [unclassified Pseudoxanthomonas]PPJ43604.1 GAF domain-containing protein [Pseudoxanthomonas sp. KAs_5_3]SFV35818.1 GAF domain-containing protein [Pseudoxanthomonas sp. YR558]